MSPLVVDGDLCWSSRRNRSNMKRKRITRKKLLPISFHLRRKIEDLEDSIPGFTGIMPRMMIEINHFDGICGPNYSCHCAHAALSYLNQRTKGPKFEFVAELNCMMIQSKRILHSNFRARPKDGSENDIKIFFAELAVGHARTREQKQDDMDKGITRPVHSYLTCTRLPVIIRSSDCKTGLYGCRSCSRSPGYVMHPKRGRFAEKK